MGNGRKTGGEPNSYIAGGGGAPPPPPTPPGGGGAWGAEPLRTNEQNH